MNPLVITLDPAASALLARAPRWPEALREQVRQTLDLENEITVGHIQAERMSGTGPFPVEQGRLGVVTNRARRSLRPARAVVTASGIDSAIGSNVRYLGAHEFGFAGTVTVRAHTRTDRRFDVYAVSSTATRTTTSQRGNLAGQKGAKKIASGFVTVRSHEAQRRIPARAPIRSGIADRLPEYATALSAAIVRGLLPPSTKP